MSSGPQRLNPRHREMEMGSPGPSSWRISRETIAGPLSPLSFALLFILAATTALVPQPLSQQVLPLDTGWVCDVLTSPTATVRPRPVTPYIRGSNSRIFPAQICKGTSVAISVAGSHPLSVHKGQRLQRGRSPWRWRRDASDAFPRRRVGTHLGCRLRPKCGRPLVYRLRRRCARYRRQDTRVDAVLLRDPRIPGRKERFYAI